MALPFPINPSLANLPIYQPGRPIEEVARELGLPLEGVIKLASNENPLGPSPRALEAMHQAVEKVHLYPDGNAFYLKHKLAEKLNLGPEHLILGNGSNEVLEFVGHALIDHDAEVVVSQYCFAVYVLVTWLFGGKLVVVPSRDYGHDLEAMLAAVTPKTRVIFVANPNNPTGTRVANDALEAFVRAVPANVLVVVDEAYFEFLDQPADLVRFVRSGEVPNLFLTRTFSKIHGLAGLRIGYGMGHPGFIGALEKVREPFNTNAVAQAAALAALDDEEHLQKTRKTNAAGLAQLSSEFNRLGIEFIPSEANFLLVKVGDGQRVFEALQRTGVITRPMGGYKLPRWIRISVGTPAENEKCAGELSRALRS